jgi:hypothetical protein
MDIVGGLSVVDCVARVVGIVGIIEEDVGSFDARSPALGKPTLLSKHHSPLVVELPGDSPCFGCIFLSFNPLLLERLGYFFCLAYLIPSQRQLLFVQSAVRCISTGANVRRADPLA